MPWKNESVFVAERQSLNVDEQKKNDILSIIESCNDLQDFIKRLEERNLIWYFIGPLLQDKNIKEQMSSKWKEELQKFEQSIDAMHKELESFLPDQNFLVYSARDNDCKIRFENKEKPIQISDILRASSEGKVYSISLGEGSQMTASKKNGNERHYNFTSTSSYKMTINWQAVGSEGNSIDCSMTVEVDSSGIKKVVSEPKFGGITSSEEVLELVKQNKEVFINGKTLHQAFAESVDNPESQLPTPSSISPSTPSSRRSSSSELSGEDEIFEEDTFDDEHEQEGEELADRIAQLEEEKEIFAKYFAEQAKQLEDLQSHLVKDEEIKQKDLEIEKLKEDLKQLQEEKKQLKQKATQNAASSSADRKEAREVQIDVQMSRDFRNVFDEKGKYIRTELSNPKSTPSEIPKKSSPLSKG